MLQAIQYRSEQGAVLSLGFNQQISLVCATETVSLYDKGVSNQMDSGHRSESACLNPAVLCHEVTGAMRLNQLQTRDCNLVDWETV